MKNRTSINRLTAIKIMACNLLLCLVFFSSCHNHINEYTIVKAIEANTAGKEKYEIELEFNYANQFLYTDSAVFAVGDTLWLRKKH